MEFTTSEVDKALEDIEKMDRITMASLWRNAPSGDIYFRNDIPTGEAFRKRFFEKLGGFTPEISKQIS